MMYNSSSIGIRIVLAIAMVAWSPAWCCCTIGAALSSEGTSQCQLNIQQDRDSEADTRPCCRARAQEQDRSPCNCHERPSELQRLDTAAKVAAPKLDLNLFVVVIPIAGHVPCDAAHAVTAGDDQPRHPPPFRTLFSQRCLLLI